MIDTFLTVGDKLELRAVSSIKDNSEATYISQIMDIVSEDELKIAVPIEKGQIIPLSVGDKYEMLIYTKRGLYQCNITILKRYKDIKVHMLSVQVYTKIIKYQRRQFYRLDCLVDITYQLIKYQNTKKIENFNDTSSTLLDEQKEISTQTTNEELYKGIMTDISGGGTRFTSSKLLNIQDKVIFNVFLPVGNMLKEFSLECNVISSEPLANQVGNYEHRLEFVELMKEERESIIKFIFEEERKLIQRGKSQK